METESKDRRLTATAITGGVSLGMLTLCIPLCWIIGSPILAYLTLGSFAAVTVGIWIFGRPRKFVDKVQAKQISKLEAELDELKGRLENVEVMSRFESAIEERRIEVERGESTTHLGMTKTASED